MDIGILVSLIALTLAFALFVLNVWVEKEQDVTVYKLMKKTVFASATLIVLLWIAFFLLGGADVWTK